MWPTITKKKLSTEIGPQKTQILEKEDKDFKITMVNMSKNLQENTSIMGEKIGKFIDIWKLTKKNPGTEK